MKMSLVSVSVLYSSTESLSQKCRLSQKCFLCTVGFKGQTSLQVYICQIRFVAERGPTESPLVRCRLTLLYAAPACSRCTASLSPREDKLEALPARLRAACQSTNAVEKLCLCSWVSRKNVSLIYGRYASCSCADPVIYESWVTNFDELIMTSDFRCHLWVETNTYVAVVMVPKTFL